MSIYCFELIVNYQVTPCSIQDMQKRMSEHKTWWTLKQVDCNSKDHTGSANRKLRVQFGWPRHEFASAFVVSTCYRWVILFPDRLHQGLETLIRPFFGMVSMTTWINNKAQHSTNKKSLHSCTNVTQFYRPFSWPLPKYSTERNITQLTDIFLQ